MNFCGHFLYRILSKSEEKDLENTDIISFTPLSKVRLSPAEQFAMCYRCILVQPMKFNVFSP